MKIIKAIYNIIIYSLIIFSLIPLVCIVYLTLTIFKSIESIWKNSKR